jgi:2-dehydropantoate 2-reductase
VTRYAVVGLGAVGGLYGARLAAAGHEVHFVVRSGADAIRQQGLELRSVDGDVTIADVLVHNGPDAVPPVDVVLVAIKTTANDALATLLPRLVGEHTAVVMFQNGLGAEEQAQAAVPAATVLGGLCFVCSLLVGPGRIDHVDYGAVTVAEHRADGSAAGVTPAVERLVGDLVGAGVKATALPDLVLARWKKLVWNVPYNGLSVVLDAGTDELMADGSTRLLVEALMREVQDGAASQGRTIEDAFVQQMLDDTEAMTPYRTSMKLDFDHGRPLELDAIYREPVQRAVRAGIALPRTEALAQQLVFLERRRPAV